MQNKSENKELECAALSELIANTQYQLKRQCPNISGDSDFTTTITNIWTAFEKLSKQVSEKDKTIMNDNKLRQFCIDFRINSEQIETMINILRPFYISQNPQQKHINSLLEILRPLVTYKTQLATFTIPDIPTRANDLSIFNCCETFFCNLNDFYSTADWTRLQIIENYLNCKDKLQNFMNIKTLCDTSFFAPTRHYSIIEYGEMQFGAKIAKPYDWIFMDNNTVYLNGIVNDEYSSSSIQQALNFYTQKSNLQKLRFDTQKLRNNLIKIHDDIRKKFDTSYDYLISNIGQLPTSALTRTR